MNKYLINATITYRVPTVEDALALRDELQEGEGNLVSFSYSTKEIKVKGEVQEEYQVVKAKFEFNDEKDPENSLIDISVKESF